ncbi:thiol-activated cytolysin family protein [Flavobacteriaceae bacterium F89]|uniref:Thiol-activated cytolysin family protein n=1 Tax=Cerina litoralis TaxID=2874477 RepID=A0AAE3EVL3_9FLAO|nr:thiol-activated cytolysin family protein [Cerina litoralis]MCG2461119.1 thiol-activated cytolysin family protein [Cerina litoralis]
MKATLFKTNRTMLTIIVGLILLVPTSCSKEDGGEDPGPKPNPEAANIDAVIANLSYDANDLLNVQDTGGTSSKRTLKGDNTTKKGPDLGTIQTCTTKEYNLESNFDDVSILRPTNGIIWPGALVVGNQGMLDGAPDPLTLDRAPVTLRLDLPGIGEHGNIIVDNPKNSTVQTGIDDALEWWNDNAYQDGYVNASNSSYQATTSYSSKQMSLDVGLNLEWATGSVASQLEYESSNTKRVAMMVYKQVFYTVTMDTPKTPSSVFGPDVTTTKIESVIGSDAPPAYINSVSYGRIIMVRMETSDIRTSVDLDAVLEYAGGVSGTGTVNSTYDEVLKKSSITVVTIGGNAEVASEAVNAADIKAGPGALNYIITGKNAVYSRDNPGVPIAYTIRYLKDNTFAKMGYSTDYTVMKCGSAAYQHKNAYVKKTISQKVRFRFSYKQQGTQNFKTTKWTEVTKKNVKVGGKPPSGAHGVRIQFEFLDVFVWTSLGESNLDYIGSERCYEAYYPSFLKVAVKKINCK